MLQSRTDTRISSASCIAICFRHVPNPSKLAMDTITSDVILINQKSNKNVAPADRSTPFSRESQPPHTVYCNLYLIIII